MSPFWTVSICRGPCSVYTVEPEGKHPAPVPTDDSEIKQKYNLKILYLLLTYYDCYKENNLNT